MLKKDPKAKFVSGTLGFWKPRNVFRFYFGKWRADRVWNEFEYARLLKYQELVAMPIVIEPNSKRQYWMFRNEFYWEDEGYDPKSVHALLLDRLRQRDKRVSRAIARVTQPENLTQPKREAIPDEVKSFVWQRDGGRCAKCGSQERLEYDHIIPVSKGGSNTARNIQLLCEKHNREKGADLY